MNPNEKIEIEIPEYKIDNMLKLMPNLISYVKHPHLRLIHTALDKDLKTIRFIRQTPILAAYVLIKAYQINQTRPNDYVKEIFKLINKDILNSIEFLYSMGRINKELHSDSSLIEFEYSTEKFKINYEDPDIPLELLELINDSNIVKTLEIPYAHLYGILIKFKDLIKMVNPMPEQIMWRILEKDPKNIKYFKQNAQNVFIALTVNPENVNDKLLDLIDRNILTSEKLKKVILNESFFELTHAKLIDTLSEYNKRTKQVSA